MADADLFNRNRRNLRAVRVLEAIGTGVNAEAMRRARDVLLEELAREDLESSVAFEGASEVAVETAVSIGLAQPSESAEDALSVLAVAANLLIKDGQFARLAVFRERLSFLSDRFAIERPFLATFLRALGALMANERARSAGLLRASLGLETAGPIDRMPRSATNLADLLASTALLRCITDDDSAFLEQCRNYALDRSDGLLLTLVDFLQSYLAASDIADIAKNLEAVEPAFAQAPLSDYVRAKQYRTLFPAQIKALRSGVLDYETRVVALPTSSGKTLLAELRAAIDLQRHPGKHAIYIAPYRLLARQVNDQLGRGLRSLRYAVRDVGSGFNTDLSYLRDDHAQPGPDGTPRTLAVMTPERLDAVMRLADSNRADSCEGAELLDNLAVLIFDELQLLGRGGRGSRFEFLMTRFRQRYPTVPVLGLCAASYGTDDLARWLGAPAPITGSRRPTGTIELLWETDGVLFQRNPRGRGVSRVTYLSRGSKPTTDAAELLNRFRSDSWPLLAIEPTRPRAEGLARAVNEKAPGEGPRWLSARPESDRLYVLQVVEQVNALLGEGHPLGALIAGGIAYHHAGVPTQLLRLIEDLTRRKLLRVLVATTTVAEGADLPFRAVVIPHLDFQGSQHRIERDLYLNIIGRAGRAGVSAEGIVFVLNSDARSLKQVVRTSLWTDTQSDRVRSALPSISATPRTEDEYTTYRDLQSQLLAWISEAHAVQERTGVDGRLAVVSATEWIASRTLAEITGTTQERRRVRFTIQQCLDQLEEGGLITSEDETYALTAFGDRVRLAGVSPLSCVRLATAISGHAFGWQSDVAQADVLLAPLAEQIASLLFESEELLAESVWLRRAASTERQRFSVVSDLSTGALKWPNDDPIFGADKSMLAGWMSGMSYQALAELVPPAKRANALFGGIDRYKLASDAAEQIGRLTYPASWVYGAVRNLASDPNGFPVWIRDAIEVGMPNETTARLVKDHQLTRRGALSVGEALPSSWPSASDALTDITMHSFADLDLTTLDRERLSRLVAA